MSVSLRPDRIDAELVGAGARHDAAHLRHRAISSRWMRRSVSPLPRRRWSGYLRIVTTGVPSSITGMKVWPMRVKASTGDHSADSDDAATTTSRLRIAHAEQRVVDRVQLAHEPGLAAVAPARSR